MSNRDIERLKNELLTNKIELSDTISQFMEKCNNNFSAIIEWGGGPAGEKGDEGEPGIPTKPKVPIHIWRKGIEYNSEIIDNDTFTIYYSVDLTDSKYQEGHLIMLKNAHVYILETNSEFKLTPKYIFTLQSYDPSTTINGENAYMHIAYANSPDGDGFVTDQELRNENVEVEPAMTYNLRRDVNSNNSSTNKIYMGVYSDNDPTPSQNPSSYTWVKIQGDAGAKGADGQKGDKGDKGDPGEQGPKGDKGDGYTGQPYTIDLEGDMSTISIDVDRTRLYDDSNDYCMCKLHAYYGDQNVLLDVSNVTVNLPEEFEYSDDNCVDIVLKSDLSSNVGKIEKSQNGKDVIIKFTPDVSFVFPTNPIIFSLHIESEITDDESKYNFTRDTVWMVKGIVSTFELEIIPKHRSIKLSEDGTYNPEKLLVDVYKNEDGKRTLFDFNQYESFTLLYKNYNDNDWIEYPNEGVNTSGVSCLEFKVVRYLGTLDEETWDYEDVWVVADGKSTHYYHADLGAMESMMVLTTGERINISENTDTPIYCAKLRDESGYSITFEPKLYDGETELTVQSISVGSNSGEEYYTNGSFERKIEEYTLTITKVPYDVEMIPMNIIVSGVDSFGVTKQDTVSFNIYISNISNIYTLSPTVSVYNTSTGTDDVDTIGCNVYKNNNLVEIDELNTYALTLEYIVCGEQGNTDKKNYTKPIVYGYDISGNNDDFTASDVAIEFILSYRNKEVAMATVPLIKDGQNGKDGVNGKDGKDGKDGNSWQYIFCVSPKYPFSETGFSNPSEWTDDKPEDSNNELLGDNGQKDPKWFDEHKDVDAVNKFQYQTYRKWDRDNGCWGKYGYPTLYSNYSESGSGYSVMLSNPIAVIPVGDDDWSTNENALNQTDSTFVYFYNNTSDMSTSENLTISLPQDNIYVTNGNFTTERENGVNKVVFKPVVSNSVFNFGSNSQYKLPIILTYDLGNSDGDKFTTTINWTLSPIKGLSDVEVYVDKRIVNISENTTQSIKVGYYLKSSDGTKTFVEDKTSDNKGYKIFLTDDIDVLTNEVNDWTNAEYTFVYDDGNNKNCYVVLTDSNGNKLDYVNVTSIKDGENGKSAPKTHMLYCLGTETQTLGRQPDFIVTSISQILTNPKGFSYWLLSNEIPDYSKYFIPIKDSINNYTKVDYLGSIIYDTINFKYYYIFRYYSDNSLTQSIINYVDITHILSVKYKNICLWQMNGVEEIDNQGNVTNINFSKPVRITGESGDPGQDGTDIDFAYCLSDVSGINTPPSTDSQYYDENGHYKGGFSFEYINGVYAWTDEPIGVSDSKKYEYMSSRTKVNGEWSTWTTPTLWSKYGEQGIQGPQGIQGEQGPQGEQGQLGKVVYPAGEFEENKMYRSTETKTPYVIDTDKNYYVLKSASYKSLAHPKDAPNYWEKFESFEAIYAKIAMIDNGTIGSAVYSGDFMFSQQGVDSSGNTTTTYQNFNKTHIYDSSSTFKPNICINFNTGQMWAAGGNIEMASNGDINMNGNINMDGNITIGGDLNLNGFFKRIKTEITSSNYNSYTTTTNKLTYIDIKKCGTYIHVTSLPSGVTQINLPYHKLPYRNDKTMPSLTIDRTGIELMRQIYGTEIIIVNDTTKDLLIGCRGAINGGTSPSGTIPLYKGCMEIFKLGFQETSIDASGNSVSNGKNIESYCWLPTSSGTISGGTMSNNTNAGNITIPFYPDLDTNLTN